MFNSSKPDEFHTKEHFLELAKQARQERANERKKEECVACIQACVRGFVHRRKFGRQIRNEIDGFFVKTNHESIDTIIVNVAAIDAYKLLRKFFVIFNEKEDEERFKTICRYLVGSMDSENLKNCYASVALVKEHSITWIQQCKRLLLQCCRYLNKTKPEAPNDGKNIILFLHTLVTFTSTTTWKFLSIKSNEKLKVVMNQLSANLTAHLIVCGFYLNLQNLLLRGLARVVPCLKHAALSAAINLSIRPLISSQSSDVVVKLFICHVLSVPAVVFHISTKSPECLKLLRLHKLLSSCVNFLNHGENFRTTISCMSGGAILSLLGNLIHLAHYEKDLLLSSGTEDGVPLSCLFDVVNVLIRLMDCCQCYVVTKQSSSTHWHPLLGWFAEKMDARYHEAVPYIKKQLQLLWGVGMLSTVFHLLMKVTDGPNELDVHNSATPVRSTNFLKKAFERASSKNVPNKYLKLGSPEVTMVAISCSLYQMALATFNQLRLDILTGLCYQDLVLPHLWKLICSLGPNYGLKAFIDHLAIDNKAISPEFQILMLFCDCTTHLITILDDVEVYDQQRPFHLEDLVELSGFLNQFVFKMLWNNLIDTKSVNTNPFFNSIHSLLMLLYQRDCRRNFTSPDHWLTKEVRSSCIMSGLAKGRKVSQILLQKVPHIVPHKERVLLFRKYINKEKTVLGLTESACASPHSTLVTVHRTRIVEDGYRQLALLPPQALKGAIRVKFVNEQGLDEAGIDQDGVFKEFLEEIIKRVFNPSLNLFRVTSEERLYPSPSSDIHENHLQLFEFVGRMLGKAVYEGIVVDVPFASFFLSQVLGHSHSALYSSIDELPSLDQDLYKSLTYIKHYDADVRELDLTFSYDDDCMGQVVTNELIPGGRAVPVTNENKISYIHLMAHYRMHTQVKEQTAAFTRGFRAIVHPDWLAIFSTPEVQRLISGDTAELDLEDFRRHTKYYGGFHDNHRVICWLWDILDKDFGSIERSLFLKFVTSCSKPPLLGFAHLDPPFSIRCVDVSDDQDTGDTVGSVIRGFFAFRKRDPVNRLPTSSTCFNLLKLPNYQKKRTLREKLLYAINSNTGFELS